jgi:hypothetical protein
VPDRLPTPGPSYVRPLDVQLRERTFHVGMSRPTTTDDGWWLAVVWIADNDGVVPFRDLAAASGPPVVPPLLRLGPALSGELSGWILEEDNRLAIRLNTVVPPDDPNRPWVNPAAMRLAIKLEPARVAATLPNDLARTIQTATANALSSLARP